MIKDCEMIMIMMMMMMMARWCTSPGVSPEIPPPPSQQVQGGPGLSPERVEGSSAERGLRPSR